MRYYIVAWDENMNVAVGSIPVDEALLRKLESLQSAFQQSGKTQSIGELLQYAASAALDNFR